MNYLHEKHKKTIFNKVLKLLEMKIFICERNDAFDFKLKIQSFKQSFFNDKS